MRATVVLRDAARTPLIRFIGRRSLPRMSLASASWCALSLILTRQNRLITLLVLTRLLPLAFSQTRSLPIVLRLSSMAPLAVPPSPRVSLAVTLVLP